MRREFVEISMSLAESDTGHLMTLSQEEGESACLHFWFQHCQSAGPLVLCNDMVPGFISGEMLAFSCFCVLGFPFLESLMSPTEFLKYTGCNPIIWNSMN